MLYYAVIVALLLSFGCGFVRLFFFILRRLSKQSLGCRNDDVVLAFFHPYCAGGGGGERVLWVGVKALFDSSQIFKHIVIYAGDEGASKQEIIKQVKNRFDISFTKKEVEHLHIVFIKSRTLLEAKWYPVGTMLFQSLASALVGLECILRFTPDVFCDTMGAAFTYPVAYYLCNAIIVAYVHYPIISTDMLQKVREQRPSYNNASTIASSVTISSLKLCYYQLIAYAYSWAGRHAQVVMVNSSWTKQHIAHLWWSARSSSPTPSTGRRLSLVYPPCNTTALLAMETDKTVSLSTTASSSSSGKKKSKPSVRTDTGETKKRMILSIGQFRPEKDHMLQIRAVQCLIETDPSKYDDVELVIMGSTRHADDETLLHSLQTEVTHLNLQNHIRFIPNGAYSLLQSYMKAADMGIHTMWNEHFGISVVEMMAAGLVVVAHNSGGPRMDIITSSEHATRATNGYLASTPVEYAQALGRVLDDPVGHCTVRQHARSSVLRFSDEQFCKQFVHELELALK